MGRGGFGMGRAWRCLGPCMLMLAGCAGGGGSDAALVDANFSWPDAGFRDAGGGATDGGSPDAGTPDAAAPDSGTDAGSPSDAGPGDAGPGDAGPSDAGAADAGEADGGPSGIDGGTVSCPALAVGDTLMLDGTGDLAAFPSEQILAPGAPITVGDQFALTWDQDALYVVVVTDAFMGDGLRPFHLYLETAETLGTPTASTGKEYDSLIPDLDFAPNRLIAFRADNDGAGGDEYNGVYGPGGDWTDRTMPFVTGTDLFVRADQGAIAVRVPWSALGGCPTAMRLSGHLVHAVVANEWKTLVPTDATPWGPPDATSGGGYYEVDLTADPAIAGWTAR